MSTTVNNYLKDLNSLHQIPITNKFKNIMLSDYPFDSLLLHLSTIYVKSRKLYLSLGGVFSARVCSTMRALSAQDLFKDEIEFSPTFAEMLWFKDASHELSDPNQEIEALTRFNEISLFHEQNHRIIWRLLPPAPKEQRDLNRYLNFAESLVVTLDIALGDQLGSKLSPAFERMKVIYRSGGKHKGKKYSKEEYRQYLLAILSTTYFALETMHYDDVLKAVNYVLPGQYQINKHAVRTGLEISELFTRVTNPLWQERYWKSAASKLKKIHKGSKEDPLYLPEDPLDLEEEFYYARRAFDFFGL